LNPPADDRTRRSAGYVPSQQQDSADDREYFHHHPDAHADPEEWSRRGRMHVEVLNEMCHVKCVQQDSNPTQNVQNSQLQLRSSLIDLSSPELQSSILNLRVVEVTVQAMIS
jgi:hypothetical protein